LIGLVMTGSDAATALAFFFLIFHCITQCAISSIDPGGIHTALSSFSKGTTDEEALKMLSDLRCTPPTIAVTAEAYYTRSTGSGKQRRTETVVTHKECADFPYEYWSDSTPRIRGLEKYRHLEISIEPTFDYHDSNTRGDLQRFQRSLEDKCRGYRGSVRSRIDIHVNSSALQVFATVSQGPVSLWGHNILATRSPRVQLSPLWSPGCYRLCCWIFPGVGTLYRIAYLLSNRRVVYPMVKNIANISSTCSVLNENWHAKSCNGEERVSDNTTAQTSCSSCDGLGLRGIFGHVGFGLVSLTCTECSGSGYAKSNV